MNDPWAHLEQNFESRMRRQSTERDDVQASDSQTRQPTPRCDRTRDMFDAGTTEVVAA